MTNLEGRLLRRRRALDPPAGVRTELQIWHELAARLGRGAHLRLQHQINDARRVISAINKIAQEDERVRLRIARHER